MLMKIAFCAAAVAGIALYFVRRRPSLPPALFFLLASVFLSRSYWEVGSITVRLEQIAGLLLGLTLAADLWRKKVKLRLSAGTALVLALFPLMVAASSLGTELQVLSLKKTLIYVPYLVGFLAMTIYIREESDFREAWNFFYAAGVIALGVSLAGYALFVAGLDLGLVRMEWGTYSLRGTFVIPNILGSSAVILFVAAFLRLITKSEKGKSHWLDGIALVIGTAGILMSLTRAAWVCAVMGILLSLVLALRSIAPKALGVGLALVSITVGLTYVATTRIKPKPPEVAKGESLGEFGEPQADKYWIQKQTDKIDYTGKVAETAKLKQAAGDNRTFLETLTENPNYVTMQRRIATAKAALQDWLSSPVLGRGTDSFQIENENKPEYYLSSTWLAILHDWGIPALLFHLGFLLLVFIGLIRIRARSEQPSIKILASILLVVLVLTSIMYQVTTTLQLSIFWVLLALYGAAVTALMPPGRDHATRPAGATGRA